MKGSNTNYQLKLAIKRMKTLEFALLTRNLHYLKIKERWLARAMTSTNLLSIQIFKYLMVELACYFFETDRGVEIKVSMEVLLMRNAYETTTFELACSNLIRISSSDITIY